MTRPKPAPPADDAAAAGAALGPSSPTNATSRTPRTSMEVRRFWANAAFGAPAICNTVRAATTPPA